MSLHIVTIDGRGISNEPRCKLLPFNQLYITNKTERFSFKSGGAMWVAKLIEEDWPIVVITVRILA